MLVRLLSRLSPPRPPLRPPRPLLLRATATAGSPLSLLLLAPLLMDLWELLVVEVLLLLLQLRGLALGLVPAQQLRHLLSPLQRQSLMVRQSRWILHVPTQLMRSSMASSLPLMVPCWGRAWAWRGLACGRLGEGKHGEGLGGV